MIVGDVALPVLHVEGLTDVHVIGALMKRLGRPLDPKKGPVVIQSHGSCEKALESLTSSVKSAIGLGCPVGFVLDIDRPEDNRVEQVIGRLKILGIDMLPTEFTDNGVVKVVEGINVGIWLMPSPAAQSGKIENFLGEMVRGDDPIKPLSNTYVDAVADAVSEDNRFRAIDREKAEMHAWLAVQPTPGLPYGSAITANFLSPTNPLSQKFFAWMCKVFGLL